MIVVIDSGPVLVLAPAFVLADGYLALSHGDANLLMSASKESALFGLGTALCLILAISELTNPERAVQSEEPSSSTIDGGQPSARERAGGERSGNT